jgi:hypothetical protein
MKFLEKWDWLRTRLSEKGFYFMALVVIALMAAVLVTDAALSLHRNFLTIACDTAAVQSAIVNTLHGNWFRDTAYDGPNLLGLHTAFILLLIAPLYAVYPSVDMLSALQIIGVYATVTPIYLVGLEVLRKPLPAFLVAVTALTSPMFFHMGLGPVHPETWVTAAVFWSYLFYRQNRVVAYWVSFGFAVSCTEQAALIYIALGTSLMWVDDGVVWRRRYGKLALAGGFGWLVFAFAVVFPLMRDPGQNNLFAYNYPDWKAQSGWGLVGALMHDPVTTLGMVFDPAYWLYFFGCLGIPLLLAFGYPRTLLLLTPLPVYFLMGRHQFYLYFHAYYFQFGFFAGYLAFIFFLSRWDLGTRCGKTMVVVAMVVNLLLLANVGKFYLRINAAADPVTSRELHAAFATIPRDAAVFAPHRYSAYLSNRENMVMGDLAEENLDFKAKLNASYPVTDVRPEEIDYIVCDLQNDQCGRRQMGVRSAISDRRSANLGRLIQSGQWSLFWNNYDVVILKRVQR